MGSVQDLLGDEEAPLDPLKARRLAKQPENKRAAPFTKKQAH
uniref:Uncharacterized protein n=1 Tax=Chloracidobacterium thermophilum TaxID=458033 RepID=A8DJC9_9BACT|nr:hypothetical protein YS_M60-F11.021 [Chloracidobacterium thermophilum]